MANPLIPQGGLNRLRGSITFTDLPSLNVTAPYLTPEGIGLNPQGNTGLLLPSMTGGVRSGEPYQLMRVSIHLVRSIPFADLFKQRIESDVSLGDCTIRTDAIKGLGIYQLSNCVLTGVDQMGLTGRDIAFPVTMEGIYYINSALWN